MNPKTMTPQELRLEGLKALLEKLGPVGTIKFLQDYQSGSGDYTGERKELLRDLSLDDVRRNIERRRHSNN